MYRKKNQSLTGLLCVICCSCLLYGCEDGNKSKNGPKRAKDLSDITPEKADGVVRDSLEDLQLEEDKKLDLIKGIEHGGGKDMLIEIGRVFDEKKVKEIVAGVGNKAMQECEKGCSAEELARKYIELLQKETSCAKGIGEFAVKNAQYSDPTNRAALYDKLKNKIFQRISTSSYIEWETLIPALMLQQSAESEARLNGQLKDIGSVLGNVSELLNSTFTEKLNALADGIKIGQQISEESVANVKELQKMMAEASSQINRVKGITENIKEDTTTIIQKSDTILSEIKNVKEQIEDKIVSLIKLTDTTKGNLNTYQKDILSQMGKTEDKLIEQQQNQTNTFQEQFNVQQGQIANLESNFTEMNSRMTEVTNLFNNLNNLMEAIGKKFDNNGDNSSNAAS